MVETETVYGMIDELNLKCRPDAQLMELMELVVVETETVYG